MALPKILEASVRGFTLVEVLLVLGLLGVVGGVGIGFGVTDIQGSAFRDERALLITVLHKARASSQNNIGRAPHGVYIFPPEHPSAYVIFSGESYASSDKTLHEIIPSRYMWTLSGTSPREILFSQLSGSAYCDSEVCTDEVPLIMNDEKRGVTFDIFVNAEGRIK